MSDLSGEELEVAVDDALGVEPMYSIVLRNDDGKLAGALCHKWDHANADRRCDEDMRQRGWRVERAPSRDYRSDPAACEEVLRWMMERIGDLGEEYTLSIAWNCDGGWILEIGSDDQFAQWRPKYIACRHPSECNSDPILACRVALCRLAVRVAEESKKGSKQ
jgi:hypothetical protein